MHHITDPTARTIITHEVPDEEEYIQMAACALVQLGYNSAKFVRGEPDNNHASVWEVGMGRKVGVFIMTRDDVGPTPTSKLGKLNLSGFQCSPQVADAIRIDFTGAISGSMVLQG